MTADITSTLLGGLDTFIRYIPQLLGALAILIIGWILAGIIARFLASILDRIGVDRMTRRAGIDTFFQRAGWQKATGGKIIGFVIKWWLRLLVLEAAVPAFGISAFTQTLHTFNVYLPNVIAALFIVLIGAFLAKLAGEAVGGLAEGAGLGSANIVERVVQAVILVLVFVAALQQIHVAETLVNELVIAVLAMLVIAGGLAFGLGGRDVAAQLWGTFYESGRGTLQKVQQSQSQGSAPQIGGTARQPGAIPGQPTPPPNPPGATAR